MYRLILTTKSSADKQNHIITPKLMRNVW